MCGICGFIGRGEREQRGAVLENMKEKIRHRGPDGEGTYIDDTIAMGFRRLAIIDLQGGDQPIFSEDRHLVITFNGEIYNYRELREELRGMGYVFQTASDTEVILHGYEAFGKGILDRLRGMFAFVIWDARERELFAARDMFGIKPFYYLAQDGAFVYGSEIKSILEYPDYTPAVNTAALEQYLSYQYSVLPETFFKGIFKLAPGHWLRWKDGEITVRRYFDPLFVPDEKARTHEELVDAIDRAVRSSVQYHMVSDVEVASLLSSGVDSSYVTALFGGGRTFTVGFDYEKYNEIPYAQALSERIGAVNTSRIITSEEYWQALPSIQYYMDEPLADPAANALYFVDREAASQVKVVLSGEGADELFGGYPIYHEPFSLRGYQKLPGGLRKALGKAASAVPGHVKGMGFLKRGAKDLQERFIGNAYIFTEAQRREILRSASEDNGPERLTAPYYAKVSHLDETTQMQYIDMNFWLIGDILLKADKMSMAHSLESRVPFLDREVWEIARTIPTSEKISPENTKTAFREAAHRCLTDAQAEKKKLGFPVPIRIWLKEDKYYGIVKERFTSEDAERFFRTDALVKLLDDHRSGKEDYSRHIWTVYTFLLWYGIYFSGAVSPDAA
ncbi:MAG: asparagine synthase (glutamine-hydrolyzing) [Lachnospiraceae bacterium]|nr:asparagine synthase (glutamine-hydrolyzing) [Lachnospiraceae bacterium]